MSAPAEGAVSKGFQMFIATAVLAASVALYAQVVLARKKEKIPVRIQKNNNGQRGSGYGR